MSWTWLCKVIGHRRVPRATVSGVTTCPRCNPDAGWW